MMNEKLFLLHRVRGVHEIRLLPNWKGDHTKEMLVYRDYAGDRCSKEDYDFLKKHNEPCSKLERFFSCALVNGDPKIIVYGKSFHRDIYNMMINENFNPFELQTDISLKVIVAESPFKGVNRVDIVQRIKKEENIIWKEPQERKPVTEFLQTNFPDGLSVL
jgi:hypothetical protein